MILQIIPERIVQEMADSLRRFYTFHVFGWLDPAAASVAWPFLERMQHVTSWLSGNLCAVSALAVGAETPHPSPSSTAAGRL